jgi:hypothetical protein
MATSTNALKTSPLVNNASPLPDATSETTASIATVAAAGTVQTDATLIGANLTLISNNTAANGVRLPVGVKGQVIVVFPQLITNAPKVWPPVGGTVSGLAANANTTAVARAKTFFYCVSDDGLSWI